MSQRYERLHEAKRYLKEVNGQDSVRAHECLKHLTKISPEGLKPVFFRRSDGLGWFAGFKFETLEKSWWILLLSDEWRLIRVRASTTLISVGGEHHAAFWKTVQSQEKLFKTFAELLEKVNGEGVQSKKGSRKGRASR